jgi:hypothetical protein
MDALVKDGRRLYSPVSGLISASERCWCSREPRNFATLQGKLEIPMTLTNQATKATQAAQTLEDWHGLGFKVKYAVTAHGGILMQLQEVYRILGASDDSLLVALSSRAAWAAFWHPQIRIWPDDPKALNGLEFGDYSWHDIEYNLMMTAELRRRRQPSPLPWWHRGNGPFIWNPAHLDVAARQILDKVAGGERNEHYHVLTLAELQTPLEQMLEQVRANPSLLSKEEKEEPVDISDRPGNELSAGGAEFGNATATVTVYSFGEERIPREVYEYLDARLPR